MQITEILHSAQFIVNKEGKPISIILNVDMWEAILSMLEDMEDIQIAQKRLKNWRSKEGWTSWEQFKKELEANEL